jgi:hypothetical protein
MAMSRSRRTSSCPEDHEAGACGTSARRYSANGLSGRVLNQTRTGFSSDRRGFFAGLSLTSSGSAPCEPIEPNDVGLLRTRCCRRQRPGWMSENSITGSWAHVWVCATRCALRFATRASICCGAMISPCSSPHRTSAGLAKSSRFDGRRCGTAEHIGIHHGYLAALSRGLG